MNTLYDSVCVVTGGSRGIGYSITDEFLQKGAKMVIILDIREEEGKKAEKSLQSKHGIDKVKFITCDITKDLDEVSDQIFNGYKTVDILVNCAGTPNDFDWKKTMDVNITYLIGWSIKFWHHMRKDIGGKGGTIINISSIDGYNITPHHPVYHASKSAILSFSRSLGHVDNFAKSGVRVVALCPGFTNTNFIENFRVLDDSFFLEDTLNNLKDMKFQPPEDVAAAAVNLLESASSGSVWVIEAGRSLAEVKLSVNLEYE